MIKKISSIKKNTEFEFIGLIIQKLVGVSNNGKKYLSLEISDNSGKISAKIWDADNIIELIEIGKIYKFLAFANLYKGKLQLKIIKFNLILDSEVKWDNFIKKAPINASFELNFIIKIINQLKNKNYKSIMQYIMDKNKKDFADWPAASKYHHNVKNGLLWHTSSMLHLATCLPKIYSMHEKIDFELLYCGIILHDFGKILELSNNNNGIYKYSLRGKLVGHISIMNGILNCVADKLKLNDTKEFLLLEHMILSSHGKYEFGSPVLPKILEAEILYLLDNLDARIFSINNELNNIESETFTDRITSLESRMFYNHFTTIKNIKK